MKPTPPEDAVPLVPARARRGVIPSAAACGSRVRRGGGSTGHAAIRVRAVRFRVALLCLFAWFLSLPLRAHDPGISMAQGQMLGDTIELVVGFAPADVQQLLPADARPKERWTPEEFKSLEVLLQALATELWEVRIDGKRAMPHNVSVQLLPGDNVSFRQLFVRPPGARTLTIRALKLAELPSGHRQFIVIGGANGFAAAKKLLSAKDDTLNVDLIAASQPGAETQGAADATTSGAGNASTPTFWGFVRLGIEHIWTGYDHLLFLFALLVVCRSWKSIVAIISCFTLAHSITLALATLDLVQVPARFTEPAIAASIVFVGAENLWRRGAEPAGRWMLTFAFGLIHGFGFASVLKDLGVGGVGGGVAVPLFTFNAGVEIGQIAIASIVLPIVWQLRKFDWFVRRGVMILSAIVALAGLYWFLQRTVWA